MEERFVPAAPAEARPVGAGSADEPGGVEAPRSGRRSAIDDPRALQILTTEHWSLLTARSLVYNEAFARGGMFLAFLSATLLVLGLVSTASGFSDEFLVVAAVVLALDLFVGLASLGRIAAASDEDIRYLQGMNRLRHAYHEMVPELEPYFISSHHDDPDSVLSFYGPTETSRVGELLHGLTTMPGMISVILSAVAGGLVAVVVLLVTHAPVAAGIAGMIGFAAWFVASSLLAIRSVMRYIATIESRFPAERADKPGP